MTSADEELEGDECPHCHAIVMVGMCCTERARAERRAWQEEQLRAIAERRKAKAKRKYLARLLFQFSKR